MKKLFFILIVTFRLSAEIPEAAKQISRYRIQNDFFALANDSMLGRGTGQLGGELAAQYIASKFDEIGLQKINNDYFQNVPMIKNSVIEKGTEMIICNQGIKDTLDLYSDFLLSKYTNNAFIPKETEMVFVGYGIIAPEFDYNDYQGIDLSGKIAVMIEGEPYSEDDSYFNGLAPTIYSYNESKYRIAISRGAIASIIIPLPDKNSFLNWWWLKNVYSFEEVLPAYNASFNLNILINPEKVDLFKGTDYSFSEILRMRKKNNMVSFVLNTKMKFKINAKSETFKSPNVIGTVKGTDPELQDEYIIISAHYDHLGYGNPIQNDSIYNGAFDNAIGVSVMIELARIIKYMKPKLKRTVIFIALTGEENGLIGSRYYVDNPVVPLYKTKSAINIDGIAFIDKFKSIIGVGSEYSDIEKYLNQAAEMMNLRRDELPTKYIQKVSFNRSDQISFAQAGIPAVLLLDGINYQTIDNNYAAFIIKDYFDNIYHTPFDDLSQPVNYAAVVQHAKVLFTLTYLLANTNEEISWNQDSHFINAYLRNKAEKR